MGSTNKYNKEKRKTLTLHFYKKGDEYLKKFKDIPGSSNAQKMIYLIDYYNKHSSTPKDT